MHSFLSRDNSVQKFFMFLVFFNVFSSRLLEARKEDVVVIEETLRKKSDEISDKCQKIDKEQRRLIAKFLACMQDSASCSELDEYIGEAQQLFNKGSELSATVKEYWRIRHAYARFKTVNSETNELDEDSFGADAYLFKPVKPKELPPEEKEMSFQERFEKRYIGKAPIAVEVVINYLENYGEFSKTQVNAPSQLLLHGTPGTGKSYIAEVVSEISGLPLISVNAGSFNDKYHGESARRIRKFFEYLAQLDKPTMVFIDEIDTLATQRNENTQGEQRGALTMLLTELQKIKKNKKIFIFCATNDYEGLDPAIKSRFVAAEVKPLSLEERAQLFKKEFIDNGLSITDHFAMMLAKATNTKSPEYSEYSTVKLDYLNKEVISEFHAPYKPIMFFFKRTKYHPEQPIFDNRDIGEIATYTILMGKICMKKNDQDSKKCNWCQFAEEYIKQTGKKADLTEFSKWCHGK